MLSFCHLREKERTAELRDSRIRKNRGIDIADTMEQEFGRTRRDLPFR